MNTFHEIKASQITKNPFTMIGKEWMLVTARKEEKVNTMTASWGSFGIMWNKEVTSIVLRPQRYTKEFVDDNAYYSLSFFGDDYRKELGYLGKVSGRDVDKISKTDLTLVYEDGIPYFAEASIVIFCKKLFAQEFKPESFIQKDLLDINYPAKDYHTYYFGEIVKVLVKNEN